MSQQTLSDFFEVKRSEIIKHLAQQLKLHQLDKKQHLRTISYVKSGKAIQEQQYSITMKQIRSKRWQSARNFLNA